MAFSDSETFGKFHLFTTLNDREISKVAGVPIYTMAELTADPEEVRAAYLKALGVLGVHGTEIGHSRTVRSYINDGQTVAAEHIFWTPKDRFESTVLYGIEGDSQSHRAPDGTLITYDRKSSDQQAQGAPGMLALQYDNLAWPPQMRVVDLCGESQVEPGMPASTLPTGFAADLRRAVQV